MDNQAQIDKAYNEITYTTDGPLTAFVVLMRAMRKVAEGGDPEVYGNAYAVWMEESGRNSNMNH